MEQKTKPDLIQIEELQKKYNTPPAVYEGVKAQNGWRSGRMLTDDEYTKAVDQFSKAPMHGRKAVTNATKRR